MFRAIMEFFGFRENPLVVEARAAQKRAEQFWRDWYTEKAKTEIPKVTEMLKRRGQAITLNDVVARHFCKLGFKVQADDWCSPEWRITAP